MQNLKLLIDADLSEYTRVSQRLSYVCFFQIFDKLEIILCYEIMDLFNQLSASLACPHIEPSQLICTANQLTGFYMRATLAFNGLNYLRYTLILQNCNENTKHKEKRSAIKNPKQG